MAKLKSDTARALGCDNTIYGTMDIQKAIALPKLSAQQTNYSLQLWVYNSGFHVMNDGTSLMYVWPEYVASRGTDEVGSCILKFLGGMDAKFKQFILWSDNCGGQNKSKNICCDFFRILNNGRFDVVEQKFAVPGHFYLPNGRNLD